MTHSKRPSNGQSLEFVEPEDAVAMQLLIWIRGVVESNRELVCALERLRRSYGLLLAGNSVTDGEEILWQVEGALKDAERSRTTVEDHPV
jgi:hypothetical protein